MSLAKGALSGLLIECTALRSPRRTHHFQRSSCDAPLHRIQLSIGGSSRAVMPSILFSLLQQPPTHQPLLMRAAGAETSCTPRPR